MVAITAMDFICWPIRAGACPRVFAVLCGCNDQSQFSRPFGQLASVANRLNLARLCQAELFHRDRFIVKISMCAENICLSMCSQRA
jgi:hypothetical protein